MRTEVFGYSNDPKPWTNPFPERDTDDGIPGEDGFLWALRGGHMVSPSGWQLRPEATAGSKPTFFNSIPSHVRRLYFFWPVLPFLAFRRGRFGGYIGFKCFGFSDKAYKDFPGVNPEEIQEDNLALSGFTFRLSRNMKQGG